MHNSMKKLNLLTQIIFFIGIKQGFHKVLRMSLFMISLNIDERSELMSVICFLYFSLFDRVYFSFLYVFFSSFAKIRQLSNPP